MASTTPFTVAGAEYRLDQALDRFASYPRKTPPRFDYPPHGGHGTITREDIRRTHYVSSRISHVERDYFLARAAEAPWIPTSVDLADAHPNERGGPFDEMWNLYWHFFGTAPSGIANGKISKVLHVKYPAMFPLLDSRLWKAYQAAARTHATRYPELRRIQLRWIAVREDLRAARSSGAIEELREAMARYEHPEPAVQQQVRDMTQLTDLRLLDILVW